MEGASQPIAVVGMACRLPGARDIDEFWRNLVNGSESITEFSEDALRLAGVPESSISDPNYVRAAPVMPDVELFDAALFGMTAAEARLCDPQLRVFLELCHTALEHAGYDPFAMTDSVGVFGTTASNGYLREAATRGSDLLPGSGSMLPYILNDPAYLAPLVSYKLNLRGMSMTVLTASSSALVTAHVAAQALRAGDCDVAVAGGAVVDLPGRHGYPWTPDGVYSVDGHCRPFDRSASGTVVGSGAGVVVLKRLDDALMAGDAVRAVIRGSAVNNDGAAKVSFLAPSFSGQSAVVAEAMAVAGVHPSEIDYVEAHAAGTALCDAVEIAALSDAFALLADHPLPPASIAVGSVKSNIGHLHAAAGVAGLIKTILMLEREAIVPTVNVEEIDRRLELGSTPFTVATRLQSWPRGSQRPRIASVSSFGVGGNAHIVLSEGPAPTPTPHTDMPRPRVLTWSARTDKAVDDLRNNLTSYFAALPDQDFADAVGTLQHCRTPHRARAAAVCHSPSDAVSALTDQSRQIASTTTADISPAFLFPGPGPHRAMATGIYGSVRPFTIAMDECIEVFEQLDTPLFDIWMSPPQDNDTAAVEALLFSVEYALAAMWREFGVEPGALLGHSLGELTAATVAGVFDLRDAAKLVCARAQAMIERPVAGGMLAVGAGVADVGQFLPEGVVVAAVNSPRQTVLAGPRAALGDVARAMSEVAIAARPLPVLQALHHPDWTAATDSLALVLADAELRPPRTALYSGVTGKQITDAQAVDATFWAMQLARPVQFSPALRALLDDQDRLLIEVGPGRTLTELARAHDAVLPRTHVVATLPDGADEPTAILRAAAEAWVHGCRVDWEEAGQPAPLRRLAVPGYPYQRERFWLDHPNHAAAVTPVATGASTPGAAAGPIWAAAPESEDSPFTAVEWIQRARPDGGGPVATRRALVLLPTDREDAMKVLLAIERAGYRTVRMRPDTRYDHQDGDYRFRPGQPDDLRRALADLHDRGVQFDTFVHACGVTAIPASTAATLSGDLDLAFGSTLTLARLALEEPAGTRPPRFIVLTSGAVDVSGDDRLEPVKATTLGPVRTVLAETPGIHGRLIDIGDRVQAPDIAEELCVGEPPPVVALRGTRRWLPVERSLTLPAADSTALRSRGVNLITGGFGPFGLEVAHTLAATGMRPTLILLGPHNPLADGHPAAQARSVRKAFRDLQALGAEVYPVVADVTDLDSLRPAIADVTARTGPINAIFHIAGTPGDGVIERGDDSPVLAAMALSTMHITNLLGNDPALDFTVMFSGRATIRGPAAAAGIAAANAFLGAFAASRAGSAARVISVAWPLWHGTTVADQYGPDLTRVAEDVEQSGAASAERARAEPTAWETEISPKSHWMLDEHRAGSTPVMPESGYLDLVVGAFAEALVGQAPAIELTDVAFQAPLAESGARTLRVSFTPSGEAAFEFAVSSTAAGRRVRHAVGKVAAFGASAPEIDVPELLARMRTSGGPNAALAPGESLFTLGPRWQNIVDIRQAGDDKLVSLALMPAFAHDLSQHRLHPAMLDNATAAVRAPGEGSFVPFRCRRVVFYRNLPASFCSHVRRQPSGPDTAVGDIDLFTEDGAVLATVEGFTMRPFHFSDCWDQPPVPAPDPATLSRLLMRLLAIRSSSSVLIRPQVAGRRPPVIAAGPSSSVMPAAGPVTDAAGPSPAPGPSAGSAPAASVTRPPPTPSTPDFLLRLTERF